ELSAPITPERSLSARRRASDIQYGRRGHGCLSRLLDRIFGKDLLDLLEGDIDRVGRLASLLCNGDHCLAVHVLSVDFRHRWIVGVVGWLCRAEQALLDVAFQMRVLRILPEWSLGQLRHHRQPAAQPGFDESLQNVWLDEVLEEFLGYRDVLGSFGDQGVVYSGDGS